MPSPTSANTSLLRYVHALYIQVSQSAACNGRHTVTERLARWLLMAHDRAESRDLPLTHEFLSIMLGVRRSGITVAAGALKTAGLIGHRQGHITIIDRRDLEQASCECYRVVQREYGRLLAYPSAARAEPRARRRRTARGRVAE